jgi:hypothetical protein
VTRSERYLCTIARDEDTRITAIGVTVDDLDGGHRSVKVAGQGATHAAGPLQEVLRSAGMRGRHWTSPEPLELPAALGAHAELLLRAIKPLRRLDRIDNVAEGVAGMSREEASYWHAQTQRRHGLRALRILLDGGRNR